METSSQTHFRSISLPARLHPIGHKIHELQKLNSWQIPGLPKKTAQTLPTTSDSIISGLVRLAEMYNSVQEMAQCPTHKVGTKSVEELLSDSLDLLDACSAIGYLLQTVRESVQSLQSALRRKGRPDGGVQQDIAAYLSCRKKINKCAAKTLKSLKNLEHRVNASENGGHDDFNSVLRELTGTSIGVFRSILGFLNSSHAATGNNPGGWPLASISKLMTTRSSTGMGIVNEIGNVDFAVKCLQGKMRKNRNIGDCVGGDDQVRRVQVSLQEVDDVIRGFEGGLERMSRQLVRTRVHLLNIITHRL